MSDPDSIMTILIVLGMVLGIAAFAFFTLFVLHKSFRTWSDAQNFLILLFLLLAVPASTIFLQKRALITNFAKQEVLVTNTNFYETDEFWHLKIYLSKEANAYIKVFDPKTQKSDLVLSEILTPSQTHSFVFKKGKGNIYIVTVFINGKRALHKDLVIGGKN